MYNFQSALIPQPLLPLWEKGARVDQSTSPALGDGFRVRGFGKVVHCVRFSNLLGIATLISATLIKDDLDSLIEALNQTQYHFNLDELRMSTCLNPPKAAQIRD